jgi:hypothetical protein
VGNQLQLDPIPRLAFQLRTNPENRRMAVRGTKMVQQQIISFLKSSNNLKATIVIAIELWFFQGRIGLGL